MMITIIMAMAMMMLMMMVIRICCLSGFAPHVDHLITTGTINYLQLQQILFFLQTDTQRLEFGHVRVVTQ